ncbi:MAG: CNNM domain-containing protein [Prevotellaceae bacterium]|jgi:CBS domain containing-hemolysin-like protein|nr:CNNM domain-containing protein [Prevotellaceae bacterium]
MTLLFIYLFIALFTSFVCSIMEAVLLSVPAPYLKSQAEQGSKGAEAMIRLKENVDKPLSAILSLNTMAHTVGATGIGMQATLVFGEAYVGLVSAILTILILVLTEIMPKTIGTSYCKELVGVSARVTKVMIFITYPFVLVSAALSGLLSKDKKENTTSREEISALASIGRQEGIIADKENSIIQNLIRLKSVRIAEVMTPRTVVVAAGENMTLQEFLKNKDFLNFSRIPIYRENRDDVTGYVLRDLVFEKLAEDRFDLKLKDIRREIVTFPEAVTVFDAWDRMLAKKEHIALVVDEYGGMGGVVTVEDIVESLLGVEIVDEKDKVEDMQQYALERWKSRQKKR